MCPRKYRPRANVSFELMLNSLLKESNSLYCTCMDQREISDLSPILLDHTRSRKKGLGFKRFYSTVQCPVLER
jgi:hypothetical protein